MSRRALPLSLAILLAGCKLIDQTTFQRAPQGPPPSQLAALPPVQQRTPLLSIRYTTPDPNYADALREGVSTAEERRPGTDYDVVAVVPARPDPAQLNQDLLLARQDAASVMRSMMALGIPDTRINLGAASQPGLTVREVRVYLR